VLSDRCRTAEGDGNDVSEEAGKGVDDVDGSRVSGPGSNKASGEDVGSSGLVSNGAEYDGPAAMEGDL
jgi:hypothetical protein